MREGLAHDPGAQGNPLCIALDVADRDVAWKLARATAASVGWFKVGLTSFAGGGRDLVEELARIRPVFLDLKLHDIPDQVAKATAVIAAMGASLTTVHVSGGGDMVAAAVEGAAGRAGILGVTVLTSLDASAMGAIGMSGSPEEAVLRLAELALEAGATGVVCSPREVESVRARFGDRTLGGPLLVVPGVRPAGTPEGDQRRTMPPAEAIERGADIVVGRPISSAPDPAAAARRLLEDVSA